MSKPKDSRDVEHYRELKRWNDLFNMEVHGARMSFAVEGQAWIQGLSSLPIFPTPDSQSFKMYLNRSSEIAWILLRTFPFLQVEPKAFGSEWARKWQILDESFHFMVEGLERIGKKVAAALIHFVDTRFSFNPESIYYRE
jgi:hypothetical protein